MVAEICRKLGVTEGTFCQWKKQYAGLDTGELRELSQLRDENRRLRQVVADLTLDKTMLRDALGKSGTPHGTPRGGGVGTGDLPRRWKLHALAKSVHWLGPIPATQTASLGPGDQTLARTLPRTTLSEGCEAFAASLQAVKARCRYDYPMKKPVTHASPASASHTPNPSHRATRSA